MLEKVQRVHVQTVRVPSCALALSVANGCVRHLTDLHLHFHHRHHVLVPKAGHWYTDGAQWMRATQRRSASFDTSVFWLANEAGAAAWKTALRNPDTKVLRAFSVDACRNSGVGAAEVGAGAGAGAGSGVGAGTGTRHRAGTSRHGNAQHATASAGRKRKRSVAKGVAPQSNWARLKATMQASSTKAARKRHPRKRERKKK